MVAILLLTLVFVSSSVSLETEDTSHMIGDTGFLIRQPKPNYSRCIEKVSPMTRDFLRIATSFYDSVSYHDDGDVSNDIYLPFTLHDLSHPEKSIVFLSEDNVPISEPEYAVAMSVYLPSAPHEAVTVPLSETLFLGLSSAVFLGHGFFLLFEGADRCFYRIDLSTGNVTRLVFANARWMIMGDGWMGINGIAEMISPNEIHIWYKNVYENFERQILGSDDGVDRYEPQILCDIDSLPLAM